MIVIIIQKLIKHIVMKKIKSNLGLLSEVLFCYKFGEALRSDQHKKGIDTI